uniref:FAM86 N-terminal domain-containing protein n=1 Tax=Panthera tigris altaica TaxID=74533 RepID=A0A8C9M1T7_PANTA
EKLRDSSGPELLLDILQKVRIRITRSNALYSLEARVSLKTGSFQQPTLCPLSQTVKHPLCVKHPPSVKYARCFLSELIRKPSGDSVTLSESTAIISHGTTGLVTWDAALYLAEWAMQNPAAFAHRCAILPRNCPLPGPSPAEALCLPEKPAGS